VSRTIRERPRLALLVGLGLACLVAVGALAGVLVAGGEDSPGDAGPTPAQTRQARELRAARANLDQAGAELSEARAEAGRAQRRGAAQRARADSWRRRAQRLEQRNRALRRVLARAREE
jgi:hypothetical protein